MKVAIHQGNQVVHVNVILRGIMAKDGGYMAEGTVNGRYHAILFAYKVKAKEAMKELAYAVHRLTS